MSKPEQDTSDWGLNEKHAFDITTSIHSVVNVDANEGTGVWLELQSTGDVKASYYNWIPPEVAEAIGTMLLYAAQKHREEFPNGDRE